MANGICYFFFKKNFKKSFQIVDKGVLVTCKYDLHPGRPRINENGYSPLQSRSFVHLLLLLPESRMRERSRLKMIII